MRSQPAPLTRPSTRPTRSCTPAAKAAIDWGFPRSSGRKSAVCPSARAAATVAVPPASSMSPINTRAPSRASSSAVARPIPEAPPVTMTARFCISMRSPLRARAPMLCVVCLGDNAVAPLLFRHLQCSLDNGTPQLVRREIAPLRPPAARPDRVVAAPIVEAKLREGARQAREMIAVKGEDRIRPAIFQAADQNPQHLVRSAQPVEIAIQLRALLEPRPVIAHRDREDDDARSFGVEHA